MTSFKIAKRILASRGQQGRMNGSNEDVLKQLTCLLKPFTHVLQLIPIVDEPSLYMVLICSLTLRRTMASFDEILKYQTSSEVINEQRENDSDAEEDLETPLESEGKRRHLFVLLVASY